ncbi:DnaB-like helicase C-terminal domain-containing protein [Streptomyces sp. CdTB01]|uniref:DnaB-like helicase C-terminal domain-containing protein n=1 Tax=Streptomyces sp. CdTB01 TaxID=1725411 RepID=UPI00073A86F6|nr:DnaB-like helicase C-terminal domain-containing protein [Streptomyces sp. CdTB01]ALV39368.1 ATP-binding protein [Streptomyces sp. CdTB01]
MNATAARNALYSLVRLAEEDGRTTLIHKRQDRALLAPLDRLPAARKTEAFPSHVLSAAQKDFGDLVTLAAQGQPQVLLRNTTPVAVLLPADPASSALSTDTAARPGAAPAGGAVNSQGNQDRGSAPRRLATLRDAIGSVLTDGPVAGPTFGLPRLDAATGGLQRGRLTLVAARPSVGGSLLGLAAARRTALVDRHMVLYAASGPNRDDIFRRIISAEAEGDYPRLKQGRLTEHEQQIAHQLTQAGDLLLIDDGSDLTAEDIAETAPHMDGLALVVVDRLQAAHSARLPLSGDRLPAASQVLAGVARTLEVPVLAVVDSDDPALLDLMDADILVTLAATADPSRVQVTVTERDFGVIGSAYLQPDLLHARFLDVDPGPQGRAAELAEAALPYTSGAQKGLPADATRVLADFRATVAKGDDVAVDQLAADLVSAFKSVTQLPDTAEGRLLANTLRAYHPALRAYCPALRTSDDTGASVTGTTQQQAPAAPAAAEPAAGTEQTTDDGGEDDAWVQPGDEEEPEGIVFPALSILKDAVGRSTYHPISVIRKEDRDAEPWTIFSEVMDGEPRWVHPDITTEKTKAGKRDRLVVPEGFGDGLLCTIDRNGSYPSACSGVPLAPNKLLHTGPMEEVGKDRAGAFLITVPAWPHRNMPHPLGRLAERTDDHGRVWVTTPHLRQMQKLIRDGHITDPLVVHDSWTGKANESLFKHFYQEARRARAELVQAGGEPYVEYKRRLSIALRLLWPKGEKVNSPFWRPDWRMALVAEASVRHWSVAWRAVQAGHALVALRNVDEAVFFTPDGNAPDTYKVGTGFGEVKVKSDAGSDG